MRDSGKFVHDNTFLFKQIMKGSTVSAVKGGKKMVIRNCMCVRAVFSVSVLFSLMHLTLCDKVNAMLDEFTGRVRALLTCATL